jgi:hypothetical protein
MVLRRLFGDPVGGILERLMGGLSEEDAERCIERLGLLYCAFCGEPVSRLEVSLRRFNTRSCRHCNRGEVE